MKKSLKIAGTVVGVAALAALLPYGFRKDRENGELTVNALLWQFNSRPDPEEPGKRKISIELGFHNSFYSDDLSLLGDENDDPILDCTPVEETPAEEEPVVTESDCLPF